MELKRLIPLVALIMCLCSIPVQAQVNPYQEVIENFTADELDMLLSMTWYEANNQSINFGQRAVIEVTLNRILSDEFPNTLTGVLSQKGQYATWGAIKRNPKHYGSDQIDALQLVYEEIPVLPDTGYLFFSRGKQGWCKRHVHIEQHWFGG